MDTTRKPRHGPNWDRGVAILNHEDCSIEAGGNRYLTDLMIDAPYLRMLDFDGDGNPEFKSGGQSMIIRTGLELSDPFVREVVFRNICHYREIQKWIEDPRHRMRPSHGRSDRKTSRHFRDAEEIVSDLSKRAPLSEIEKLVRSYKLMGDGSEYRFPEIGKDTYLCATRLSWDAPDKTGSDSDGNGRGKRDDRDQKTLGIDFRYFDDMGAFAGGGGPLLSEIVYQMFEGVNRYEDRRFTVVQWVPDIIDPMDVHDEMTFEQMCDAFRGVTQCLVHLGKKEILHRDIKPDNIMMSRRGDRIVAVLGDMGMAKSQTHKDSTSQTMEGTAMGTPAYMSPEMLRGEAKNVGIDSDIFSLGLTFHEMLSGKRQEVDMGDCYTRLSDWTKLNRPFLEPLRAIDGSLGTKRKRRYMDELLSSMIQYNKEDRYIVLPEIAEDIWSVSKGGKPRNAREWARDRFEGMPTQLDSAFDMRGTGTPYVKYAAIGLGITLGMTAAAALTAYLTNDSFRDAVDGLVRSVF